MTLDDRIQRHLAGQADAIALPSAEPTEVKRRGARRRNRRRGTLAGAAAVLAVALVGSTVARFDDDPERSVTSGVAASVVASPFDWTVVEPSSGLGGYSRPLVQLEDGSIYGLSTAPGPFDPAKQDGRTHLYRSGDGAEWVEMALPDGLTASSLAATGGTLYAIGTAPAAGGSRDLVVAASQDGATSWAELELPDEVADLDARFPDQISISQPTVASTDGSSVVASVVVTATPDLGQIPGWDDGISWEYTDDGVVTEPASDCPEEGGDRGCPDPTGAPSTTVVGPDGEITSDTVRQAGGPDTSGRRTYTWDELGIDPELRELIGGRTYVYASGDGATFEPVTLPGGPIGVGSALVATADGYRMFLGGQDSEQPTTRVLRSADGRTWQPAGELPGWPQSAGELGGAPAVAVHGLEGGLTVHVGHDDGSWSEIDPADAVDGGGVEPATYDVAFGPLGLAAVVVTPADDPDDVRLHLVHSGDGSALSAVSIDDLLEEPVGTNVGLAVTADAITVRVTDPNDGDPSSVPSQRVLVGTPAG